MLAPPMLSIFLTRKTKKSFDPRGWHAMVIFPVLGQVGREDIWGSIPCFSNLIERLLPPFIVKKKPEFAFF